MTRVQILLTEKQDRRLEALARRLGTSKAALVREGVDVLNRREARSGNPLLGLIGQAGPAGRKEISRHHDAYLLGAERRRNS